MAAAGRSICPAAYSSSRRCFPVVSYHKMTELVVEVSSNSYCCCRNFVAEDSLSWRETAEEAMGWMGVGESM